MNIFNLTASLTLDKSQYEKGIDDAKDKGKDFASSTEKNIGIIATNAWLEIAQKVAGYAKAVANLTLSLVNYADKYDDLSAKYDMSTQSLQEFEYIASQTGTTLEQVLSTMTMMYNKAKENNEVFEKLGVSVRDTNGNMKTMDTLFWEVKSALDNVNNSGDKSALMLEAFGRNAMSVGEFIKKDSDELNAMAQRAHELGIVLDTETTTSAGKFNDVLAELKLQAQSAFTMLLNDEEGAEEAIDNFFENVEQAIDKYLPKFVKFMIKFAVEVAKGIAKNIPTIISSIIEGIIDAIFEINWLELGWEIAKGIINGIIQGIKSLGENLAKVFTGGFNNKSTKKTSSSYDFNDDEDIVATNNYNINRRQTSTVEIKLTANGTSAIDDENVRKIANELLPIIDKKLGGML